MPDADRMDADGALLCSCLLHLAGHQLSAQCWWQLTAGADAMPPDTVFLNTLEIARYVHANGLPRLASDRGAGERS
ncbi:hypothetical protein ACFXAZ_25480 [Streptomyces sp. NPDC059477]|uniref:hypothetical protein n=1 Tax=Streptomyces sp. NPDC059477 TaxID=3346847 RepID=UPI0036ABA566